MPQAVPSGERRLKLIIEAAPVSLMILDPSGRLLAANRAALSLFGIARLDAITGATVGALVSNEDRDHFTAFVTRVCLGEPSSLEYAVVRPDGSRCAVETHAVPVQRADGGPAVFLGASWDVSVRHRSAVALEQLEAKYALAESDRDVLRTALEEARAAASSADRLRAVERSQADEAISRLQAALADTNDRHARLANEWAAEREHLMIRLARGDEEKAGLISELRAEQASSQTALEAAARGYQQSLERATEQHARSEQEWRASRERYEADAITWRAERDQLAQGMQDVNKSYAALVSEHATERAEFEAELRRERSRYTELVGERELWREDLGAILRALSNAGAHTQQLLDRCRNIRLVSTGAQGDQEEAAESSAMSAVATGTDQECSWQF